MQYVVGNPKPVDWLFWDFAKNAPAKKQPTKLPAIPPANPSGLPVDLVRLEVVQDEILRKQGIKTPTNSGPRQVTMGELYWLAKNGQSSSDQMRKGLRVWYVPVLYGYKPTTKGYWRDLEPRGSWGDRFVGNLTNVAEAFAPVVAAGVGGALLGGAATGAGTSLASSASSLGSTISSGVGAVGSSITGSISSALGSVASATGLGAGTVTAIGGTAMSSLSDVFSSVLNNAQQTAIQYGKDQADRYLNKVLPVVKRQQPSEGAVLQPSTSGVGVSEANPEDAGPSSKHLMVVGIAVVVVFAVLLSRRK